MKVRNWIVALLCLASTAWASPLKTYVNDYNGDGYLTVSENGRSGSANFSDLFDFTKLDYLSIDSIELTLNYAKTNGSEDWLLRIGAQTKETPYAWSELADFGSAVGSTTFTINSRLTPRTFASILDSETLSFWFVEDSWNRDQDSFRLYSASLTIYGKPEATIPTGPTTPSAPTNGVPEPESLALLGVALAGLGILRRRPRTGR